MIKTAHILMILVIQENLLRQAGVALDEKRRKLYVADAKKHNITAYSLDGKFLHTIGKRGNNAGEFNFPTSIALDSSGNLYVVDTGNFRVQGL